MGCIEYPCKTCTRVKNPDKCRSVKCDSWIEWFLWRWSKLNRYYEKYRKITRGEEDG